MTTTIWIEQFVRHSLQLNRSSQRTNRKQEKNVATGAIGLTAPKVKAGGRGGLAEGKAPIPALGADVILGMCCCSHLHLRATLFCLWLLSWFFSESFDSERAIMCEILFDFIFNFFDSVQSSLIPNYNIYCDKWRQELFRRKRTDRLQLHAELASE